LTKEAQQLVEAIDDTSITVNLEASSSYVSSKNGKQISGGEFQGSDTELDIMGNSFTNTYQQINPVATDDIDYASGAPNSGRAALHEAVESHLGGIEAQKRGLKSVAPATLKDSKNQNSVYNTAHEAAPIGTNRRIYLNQSDGRTYVKTSWGKEIYLQPKKN
jgi:hypothetical protein